MKNKVLKTERIIALVLLMVALLLLAAIISSSKAYKDRRAAENLGTVDMYNLHEFSEENSKAVMKALSSGNADKLAKLMTDSEGVGAVMEFADWKSADFENAVSMGSGTLDEGPDEKGRMEVSERFFVDVGDTRYVLFIETATSRWGRQNDGVSAVGVTTFKHFDDTDYAWNGEPDDSSVLAGKLLWNS